MSLGKRGGGGSRSGSSKSVSVTGSTWSHQTHSESLRHVALWELSFLYDNSLHAHLSTDLGLLVDKFHVLRVWDLAHSMYTMQKEKWKEEMNEWMTAAPRSCLWIPRP